MPESSERGQVLILFVLVFTVFLVLAAFAVDQGFWYGRQGVAQGQASVAARDGAAQLLSSTGNSAEARTAAAALARANGVASGDVSFAPPACDTGAGLRVDVHDSAPGLFSSLPLVSGTATSGVSIDTTSTACVGAAEMLRAQQPQGLPIALNENYSGSGSCFFSDGQLRLGHECAIFRSHHSNGAPFGKPAADRCLGSFSSWSVDNNIEDGIGFTCKTNSSGGCGDPNHCVDTGSTSSDTVVNNIFDGMHDRLRRSTSCASLESGEPPASFQNAFGNADGDPGLAPDPPALGGSAGNANHVYIQNDCYNNPRVVVMPITEGASGDVHVTGFATMYLTGCHKVNEPPSSPGEAESNHCHGVGPWECGGWPWGWNWDCWQIRAIPIRLYVPDSDGSAVVSSVGDMKTPSDKNAPLTIQTVDQR